MKWGEKRGYKQVKIVLLLTKFRVLKSLIIDKFNFNPSLSLSLSLSVSYEQIRMRCGRSKVDVKQSREKWVSERNKPAISRVFLSVLNN